MIDYGKFTDQELATLLAEGDHVAFTQIYTRYKFILYTHAVNKLRDREDAMDIIQEVFTYLWFKRETIQLSENLPGYLYGAVRNAILNKVTHKQVQEKYFSSMASYSEEGNIFTDQRVRESLLKEYIEKEIILLPSKMREVFELSRKQRLSHKEIACQLEISEQTVSKQITNALKILRVKLGILIYLLLMTCHYANNIR